MSKALVTGGGGFLGRAIVAQLLERGHEVRVFSRRRFPDLEARGVECALGDLGDASAVAGACRDVDVVYHVAALAGAWGPRERFERTNVLGTEHVISGCRARGVGKLVFTSSPSVVSGPEPADHQGASESLPYPDEYLADYPRTKAQSERAVLAANASGLLTCALRPHLIVGPGDPHLVPRVLQRARARKLRIVGEGTNTVDLTFVDNAARAHLQAASALESGSPVAGKAYFVSNGEPVQLWPWINALLAHLEIAPVRRKISYRAAFRLGGALERTWRWLRLSGEPPMTRFVANQLSTSHWFDICAARRDFGYDPERIPMDEATRRIYADLAPDRGEVYV